MSMAKKEKAPVYVTPRGVFIYPHLTNVDYGTEEYPKPEGEYNVIIKLTAREAQPLIDKLTPLHREAVAQGEEKFKDLKPPQKKKLGQLTVNEPYTEEYDRETEEPTGNLLFKFKTKASGTKDGKAWSRKLPLFDAAGTPLDGVEVWGGSEGKVSFSAVPYFVPATGTAGVSFYLNAVQVLELRQGGGSSAESFGFEEEEGFEAEESTKASDVPWDEGDGDTQDPDF
jgi:hypothetical protein